MKEQDYTLIIGELYIQKRLLEDALSEARENAEHERQTALTEIEDLKKQITELQTKPKGRAGK